MDILINIDQHRRLKQQEKNNKKKQHLLGAEMFCNIINVFIVTFNQCHASLLNKKYYFYLTNMINININSLILIILSINNFNIND